jgi:hypothetical protein
MKKPKVERKKHQLLVDEVESMLRVANVRDKAIFFLGMCGQDESTVAGLRVEQFEGKLNGEKLEFVDLLRPKTNEEILLVLTPEVQDILAAYIKSLGKKEGWLFLGYKKRHIQPSLCNDIFKDLCKRAQVKEPNGKRLSYHCCRMWFSMQLRGRVSDDIIDLLTGHALRYQGAYMEDVEKIRKLLTEADIVNALRLQNVRMPGKEEELRKKSLLDFAKLQGYGETELKRLEDVLGRAKDVDEAIREFRRFREEPETMHNGNGKYLVARSEEELIQRLRDGYKLVQPLNHNKYLLERIMS